MRGAGRPAERLHGIPYSSNLLKGVHGEIYIYIYIYIYREKIMGEFGEGGGSMWVFEGEVWEEREVCGSRFRE